MIWVLNIISQLLLGTEISFIFFGRRFGDVEKFGFGILFGFLIGNIEFFILSILIGMNVFHCIIQIIVFFGIGCVMNIRRRKREIYSISFPSKLVSVFYIFMILILFYIINGAYFPKNGRIMNVCF